MVKDVVFIWHTPELAEETSSSLPFERTGSQTPHKLPLK
jgi:hypothetical protein